MKQRCHPFVSVLSILHVEAFFEIRYPTREKGPPTPQRGTYRGLWKAREEYLRFFGRYFGRWCVRLKQEYRYYYYFVAAGFTAYFSAIEIEMPVEEKKKQFLYFEVWDHIKQKNFKEAALLPLNCIPI